MSSSFSNTGDCAAITHPCTSNAVAFFEAELVTAAKEKTPGGSVRRHVEVQGMDPKVFKAMLHFIYTDTLLEMEEDEAVEMAGG
ncbi:hypothetical protein PR202_gb23489 [Eleusine coracana subsp. coracana]|uniref:BTB domain-containing protein n=1 Tax=Eleusine coracana subsp. coracana TaxID=191504 RepID=A0AAV5FJA2_ELECO|nr:hypothetical protein PR202_gb23489 [Eleusine coracana subsp. coracana]